MHLEKIFKYIFTTDYGIQMFPVFIGWVLFRAIVNDCFVITDRNHILQRKLSGNCNCIL